MSNFYEYSDVLNSPIEAFYCKSDNFHLPVEPHWHYFVEILYVFEGNLLVTCNEHSYQLTPGCMFLLPPQAIHAVYNSSKSDKFYYACIKFNINRIQLVGNYLPNLNVQLRKIAQLGEWSTNANHQPLHIKKPPLLFAETDFKNKNLTSFFHELVEETSNRYYGYNSYIYTKLSGLMIKLLRVWYYHGISVQTDSILEKDEYSMQDVLIYIDEHSHENINIEQLAHMCNMSYSYFAKVFHRQYGQSCKHYIEFIRLSKAENLLLFTDLDLTTIASETGFSDCSHLIRSFRKNFQITPKQFRLKHQKQYSNEIFLK